MTFNDNNNNNDNNICLVWYQWPNKTHYIKALCRRASETALGAASLYVESGLACQMLLHTVACNYA